MREPGPFGPAPNRPRMEARCRVPAGTGGAASCRARCSAPAAKRQELFTKAYHGAVQVYREEDRAVRAAFSVLKQKFEKRGDQWVAKRDAEDVT